MLFTMYHNEETGETQISTNKDVSLMGIINLLQQYAINSQVEAALKEERKNKKQNEKGAKGDITE